MKIITHLLVSIFAIIVSAYIVPGVFVTLYSAVILSIVLGVINIFIKPFVKFISLPLTILTLGLFSLVINAVFIMIADKLVNNFSVSGFWTAMLFSIVLSLINGFFNKLEKDSDSN